MVYDPETSQRDLVSYLSRWVRPPSVLQIVMSGSYLSIYLSKESAFKGSFYED